MRKTILIALLMFLSVPALAQWDTQAATITQTDTVEAYLTGRIAFRDSTDFLEAITAPYFNGYVSRQGMSLSDTTKFILYSDTTTLVGMQWELNLKLWASDTTGFRTYSDALY